MKQYNLGRRAGFAAVVTLAMFAAACGNSRLAVDEEEPEETVTTSQGISCGVERWSVKTGTDPDVGSVNLTPQDNTIANLVGFTAPASPPPNNRVAPQELTTYRLRDVTLTQYKLEGDSDFHLILSDGANTMIAEIPDPGCVGGGSPFAAGIQTARSQFTAVYTPSTSFQTANATVSVIGVGFFDFQHGQTGVAPNAIELHAVLGICFGAGCQIGGGGGGNDFSITGSPSSSTVAPGASTSYSISTAVTSGSAQTVTLSVSGLPAGATSSFTPSSVTAGNTSTLNVNVGASTASGTYPLVVTGTGASATHTASVTLIVSPSGGGTLVNGGFETGTLAGWSSTGSTAVSNTAHGGQHSAQVGSASPSTDSSITQTVQLPSGSPRLSLWYQVHCPDSVQYDWASVEVRDPGGAVLATVVPNTCTNSGAWVNALADLTAFAGRTVVIALNNHDDNYSGDPTYTLYDDVALLGGQVANDFSVSSSPSSRTVTVGGSTTFSIGTAVTSGSAQTVSFSLSGAPAGVTASFSPSSVTAGSGSTLNVNVGGGTAVGTYVLVATGTATSGSHATSMTLVVSPASGPAVTNGTFETGNLAGWTSTGSTSISSTSHSGSFAAQVGSASPSNDSALTQTVSLPAGNPRLSLWYQVVCPDTVQYDWASVQVKNTSGTVLATVVTNTCTSTGTWVNATADLTAFAGQTVVISLNNHDDNYSGDPTYTLYDDIAIQ